MEVTTRTARHDAAEKTAKWRLAYIDVAERDARKFLDDDQYAHAVQLFDDLAHEDNPRLSETQDVKPIDGFFELRDKGGILRKINLRVYFAVLDDRHLILVLGADKKEDDGQTSSHIKTRIRNRMRLVLEILNIDKKGAR